MWLDLAHACREKYGRKLYRVALDGGFTCPNRDGTIDKRGCIFCDEGGSGDFAISYHGQKLEEKDLVFNHQNAGEGNYIAYFQAFTNTYGPVERLEQLYTAALENPLFAGIAIATRPDCIDEEIIALLQRCRERFPDKCIWVELGLQSKHDTSAVWMRRGYLLKRFEKAMELLGQVDVEVIVHVIIGLPYETEEMMYETIRYLNGFAIHGIKLQLLQYLKGTDLGRMYESHDPHCIPLEKEHYVHIVSQCIGWLRKDIVIHRLTGDGNKEILLAPKWAMDKRSVINAIRHMMKENQIVQGCLLERERV